MRIFKGADKLAHGEPQLIDILGCLRKVIREIYFRIAQFSQFVDRELKPVLVSVQKALDLEIVFLIESVERILDVVPHLGFDLPTPVTERKGQVRLAGLDRKS